MKFHAKPLGWMLTSTGCQGARTRIQSAPDVMIPVSRINFGR